MPDDPAEASLPLEIEDAGPAGQGKVRGRVPPEAGQPLLVVVEVTEPGYVPSTVDVRAVISDTLFTATVPASEVDGLGRDPRVVSVELSRRLGQID